MIKNVSNSQEFEGQCDEENVVRRIAPLNDVKPAAEVDPQRVQEFQNECAGIFGQIAERGPPLDWHRMPIDVHPIDNLVAPRTALSTGT